MGFNSISMCRVQGLHPPTLCNKILARLPQRVSTELWYGYTRTQTADGSPKPRTTSFFPLKKLKGKQSLLKKPAVHLAHLEEKDTGDDEDPESDDPGGIEAVTEEFMVHLARAVKDAQADEKCCYHCSSLEHFICNCPLVRTPRDRKQLNGKEGTASMKGAQTPLTTTSTAKSPKTEAPRA